MVSIRACRASDPTCASPVGGPALTDVNGWTSLTVPGPAFDGYLELSGGGIVPTLGFPGRISSDGLITYPVFDEAGFGLISDPIVMRRPDRGHFIIVVSDCNDRLAAGIRFAIEPADGATAGYLSGGFPSVGATMTDESGTGGFFNVLPNTGVRITATEASLNRSLPPVTAFARAGAISFVTLRAL
jgi:hypothetical protein